MYKADKLYDEMMALDTAIKELQVTDETSLETYFRLYTSLVYDYKWIGSIYDFYADDAKVYRENGVLLDGVHEIMQDALKLTAAFPDMKLLLRDIFAVKKDDGYKLWRYFAMEGNNLNASIYGPPTGKALNADACIGMSMSTIKEINGRWQIIREFTMYSIDNIREACRPQKEVAS
jgi:hypothetical protein